jgi:hypothetical protein
MNEPQRKTLSSSFRPLAITELKFQKYVVGFIYRWKYICMGLGTSARGSEPEFVQDSGLYQSDICLEPL